MAHIFYLKLKENRILYMNNILDNHWLNSGVSFEIESFLLEAGLVQKYFSIVGWNLGILHAKNTRVFA